MDNAWTAAKAVGAVVLFAFACVAIGPVGFLFLGMTILSLPALVARHLWEWAKARRGGEVD